MSATEWIDVEHLDPATLSPHPRNAEVYGSGLDDALVASVKAMGVLTPILATEAKRVISGHRRLEAAKKAKLKTVPVICRKFADEAAELEALVEANAQRQKSNEQMAREGLMLLEVERERAKARQSEAGNFSDGRKVLPQPVGEALKGEAFDAAAKRVGRSGEWLRQAAAVVERLDSVAGTKEDELRKALNESVKAAYALVKPPKPAPPPPPEDGPPPAPASKAKGDDAPPAPAVPPPPPGASPSAAASMPEPPPPPTAKEPPPEPALVDAGGTPIPPQAVDAFALAEEMARACRSLDAMAAEIERLGKHPAAAGVVLWQSAQTQVKGARKTLWQNRPFRVCPYCKGGKKKCEACKGNGWVKRSTYDGHPDVAKERRERAEAGVEAEGGDE